MSVTVSASEETNRDTSGLTNFVEGKESRGWACAPQKNHSQGALLGGMRIHGKRVTNLVCTRKSSGHRRMPQTGTLQEEESDEGD